MLITKFCCKLLMAQVQQLLQTSKVGIKRSRNQGASTLHGSFCIAQILADHEGIWSYPRSASYTSTYIYFRSAKSAALTPLYQSVTSVDTFFAGENRLTIEGACLCHVSSLLLVDLPLWCESNRCSESFALMKHCNACSAMDARTAIQTCTHVAEDNVRLIVHALTPSKNLTLQACDDIYFCT